MKNVAIKSRAAAKVVAVAVLLFTLAANNAFGQATGPDKLLESAMRGIATSIDKKGIEQWVADLKKKNPSTIPGVTRDHAYDAIAGSKAAKSAVVSGLAGLAPGAFSIPAEAGKMVAQWTMKAQVAYAIACLYGRKPTSTESFMVDLFILNADPSVIKESFAEVGSSVSTDQLLDLGEKAIKAAFNNPTIQKKLIEKLGEKMVKKMAAVGAAFGAAKAAKEVAEKMVAPLTAFKDAFDAHMDITQLARNARNYYFQFPVPTGRYIRMNGDFGAVLDFRNGDVTVRPRLQPLVGADSRVGRIQDRVELGRGRAVVNKDILTVTFGPVSWKNSMWNAPQPMPIHPYENWDYINVEPMFSNKAVKFTLTGEAKFWGDGGLWERMK